MWRKNQPMSTDSNGSPRSFERQGKKKKRKKETCRLKIFSVYVHSWGVHVMPHIYLFSPLPLWLIYPPITIGAHFDIRVHRHFALPNINFKFYQFTLNIHVPSNICTFIDTSLSTSHIGVPSNKSHHYTYTNDGIKS